jgi:hypothetical protein
MAVEITIWAFCFTKRPMDINRYIGRQRENLLQI